MVARPHLRARDAGAELSLPSWEAAQATVSLPEGDIAAPPGAGLSKSAVLRRFVALSAERLREWMTADLSQLGLLTIRIDGMHVTDEVTPLAAVGSQVSPSLLTFGALRRMPPAPGSKPAL